MHEEVEERLGFVSVCRTNSLVSSTQMRTEISTPLNFAMHLSGLVMHAKMYVLGKITYIQECNITGETACNDVYASQSCIQKWVLLEEIRSKMSIIVCGVLLHFNANCCGNMS